jgi:hypothetical protein
VGGGNDQLSSLTGPFVLVNVGCFLRVSLQVLTDHHAAFFRFVGVSGVLELAALAWWGSHLFGMMTFSPFATSTASLSAPSNRRTRA